MEKRVFIAVLLSFLILAAYQWYFAPPPANTIALAPAASVPLPLADTAAPGSAPSPSPAGTPTVVKGAPAVVGDARAREIVVDTDDVVAVFSTKGAVLKSWKLKHYLASPDSTGASGLLDLVPSDVAGDKPFTLTTHDAATSSILADALYRPSVDHLSLGSSSGTLNFEYQDQSGLDARKTFHFRPDGKPCSVTGRSPNIPRGSAASAIRTVRSLARQVAVASLPSACGSKTCRPRQDCTICAWPWAIRSGPSPTSALLPMTGFNRSA